MWREFRFVFWVLSWALACNSALADRCARLYKSSIAVRFSDQWQDKGRIVSQVRFHPGGNFETGSLAERHLNEDGGLGQSGNRGYFRHGGIEFSALTSTELAGFHNPTLNELGGDARALFSSESKRHLAEHRDAHPLEVMHEMGYLTRAQVEMQGEDVLSRLKPEQVTYFDLSARATREEVLREFGEIPSHARLEANEHEAWRVYRSRFIDLDVLGEPQAREEGPYPESVYLVRTTDLRVISGQSTDRTWSLALEAPNLAKPIDRSAHPQVWEIGRAAQTQGEGFEILLREAVRLILRETELLGTPLEDSYIFAHSMDAFHTRLFRSRYKMQPYSGYTDSPGEAVVYIPLSKALEVLELEANDPRLRDRRNKHMHLENQTEDPLRVEVRDFSDAVRRLPAETRRDHLFELAKSENRQNNWSERNGIYGTMDRQADFVPLRTYLRNNNLVEFYIPRARGLSELMSLVGGAYRRYLDSLRARGAQNPEAYIDENEIRFAIVMPDGVGIRIFGEIEWYFSRPAQHVSNRVGHFRFTQRVSKDEHLYAVPQTREEVLQFIGTSEKSELVEGRWNFETYVYNPLFWSF